MKIISSFSLTSSIYKTEPTHIHKNTANHLQALDLISVFFSGGEDVFPQERWEGDCFAEIVPFLSAVAPAPARRSRVIPSGSRSSIERKPCTRQGNHEDARKMKIVRNEKFGDAIRGRQHGTLRCHAKATIDIFFIVQIAIFVVLSPCACTRARYQIRK